ncbi:MAG: hypothetical protein J3K34DRAFT_435677 [Monoraphidium minutum]|nr:MAG: hypothetical protein J3K34DRAFT_435677 [Monoraphidium minutum]
MSRPRSRRAPHTLACVVCVTILPWVVVPAIRYTLNGLFKCSGSLFPTSVPGPSHGVSAHAQHAEARAGGAEARARASPCELVPPRQPRGRCRPFTGSAVDTPPSSCASVRVAPGLAPQLIFSCCARVRRWAAPAWAHNLLPAPYSLSSHPIFSREAGVSASHLSAVRGPAS